MLVHHLCPSCTAPVPVVITDPPAAGGIVPYPGLCACGYRFWLIVEWGPLVVDTRYACRLINSPSPN